jgi:hypothetical protein
VAAGCLLFVVEVFVKGVHDGSRKRHSDVKKHTNLHSKLSPTNKVRTGSYYRIPVRTASPPVVAGLQVKTCQRHSKSQPAHQSTKSGARDKDKSAQPSKHRWGTMMKVTMSLPKVPPTICRHLHPVMAMHPPFQWYRYTLPPVTRALQLFGMDDLANAQYHQLDHARLQTTMEQLVYWSWVSNSLYHGAMGLLEGQLPGQAYRYEHRARPTGTNSSKTGCGKRKWQVARWQFGSRSNCSIFYSSLSVISLNVVLVTSIVWTATSIVWTALLREYVLPTHHYRFYHLRWQ